MPRIGINKASLMRKRYRKIFRTFFYSVIFLSGCLITYYIVLNVSRLDSSRDTSRNLRKQSEVQPSAIRILESQDPVSAPKWAPGVVLPDISISEMLSSCGTRFDLEAELVHSVLENKCPHNNHRLNVSKLLCGLKCSEREPELEKSMRILNLSKYSYEMLLKLCRKKTFSTIIYIKDNKPYHKVCGDRVQGSSLWRITQRVIINLLCLVPIPDVVFGFDNLDWAAPQRGAEVPGWNQPLPGVVRYVGTDAQPSLLFPTGQFIKSTTHCQMTNDKPMYWIRICTFDDDPLAFHDKKNVILWRGSSTGVPMNEYFLNYLPRPNIVMKYFDHEGFDVGFIGGPPPSNSKAYLEFFHSHRKNFISNHDFQKYKFIMHMDGHTASWGLAQKIGFTKSIILWVKSSFNYREFFYVHLEPWKHYLPIESDFSNLDSLTSKILQGDKTVEKDLTVISENAFKERLRPEDTYCYITRLLLSLAYHQDSSTLKQINEAEFSPFPEYKHYTG